MIAFFDFDGTLITQESGRICALPAIRHGLLGPRIAARLAGTYLLSKVGLRTRTDAQKVGFECYGGHTLAELRTIMRDLHDHHLVRHLSRPMQARLDAHRAAGDHLVILTASIFTFAEPFTADFGIHRLIGTQVGFDAAGLCTGRPAGAIIDGVAKRAAAERVAAERGVALSQCTFYSDHISDLPLLEAVGHPVAVGPVPRLAKVAAARGWEIIEHR